MKVFKKVFAFAIALTAMAMATSAMAATGTATYDSENYKVAATTGLTGDAQTTVAVVPVDFGADTAAAADIYYINQDTATNIAAALDAGVGLKAALDVPSEYEVRVGGGSEVLNYVIPAYIVDVEDVNEEVVAGAVEGTKRLGFDGAITLNGGELKNLIFTLVNNDSNTEMNNTVTISTADIDNFQNNITSVIGEVTFGLEIEGVPEGVTVTLQDVQVSAE